MTPHRLAWSLSASPRPLLLLLTLTFILTAVHPATAADCPAKCRCSPDTNNTVADCSQAKLTTPPKTSLDTVRLDLSHNALGPIINESLPRMSKLVDLDLSYNGIERLLLCTLQGLRSLTRLSLRGNRLTSLPDSLFDDSDYLEHLDISHNVMAAIPDRVVSKLPQLKTLDASHNRMVVLELGPAWQVPRHLLTINLSHNHFQVLTEDSFQIASRWEPGHKRTLNLAHCRLTSIQTPALSKIPGLYDLDLSGNPELPPDNLTSAVKELEAEGLERLSISGLNLTTIEPLFAQVTRLSLKFLNASDNDVHFIPSGTFSTISSLRQFDISRNQLTALDPGFSDLRNLKWLDVSFNSLTSFKGGNVVPTLNKLEFLDISHNKLSNPANVNLSALTDLTHLDVSDNQLTSAVFPRSTKHLVHFDYHSNEIREFSGFEDVPKLKHFDMSQNDLEEVKGYLFQNAKPNLVNFSRNNIDKLNTNAFRPHSPLVIDLSHNFIKKIQWSYWLAAQEIYLNRNDITDLDFKSFHANNGLRILDLSQNALASLHEDLLDMTESLTYLNLSHNSIRQTNFPRLFRNLQHLKVLDLGHNNISHLNESMLAPIPKLRRFSLSQNHLEIVKPRVFRDLKHIENIDLSDNPFLCTCDNLGFQEWLARTKIGITGLYTVNSTAYICRGPGNRVGRHMTEWTPDQFECDNTMLYMITCGSVGLALIVAGVVSTIVYRVYKCRKRRREEKEKERFRMNCYRHELSEDNDDLDGYKKKGGQLDLSMMTTAEIAEEISNAIERRERRSMREADKRKQNSNSYVPWPANGNVKSGPERKTEHERLDARKGNNNNNLNKGRRESVEARQYDRIINQQQGEEGRLRHSADDAVKRGGERESRDDAGQMRASKAHRTSAALSQSQQRWKQHQQQRYFDSEPEPDYGYETEPPQRSRREDRRSSHWDSLDVWDKERRGWLIQGQGHRPHQRSRSQDPGPHRYMTLPIREQDYREQDERRSSNRRDNNPRMYLDQYTNEVRFGVEDLPRGRGSSASRHKKQQQQLLQQQLPPPAARQSRWDAYYNHHSHHHHSHYQQQQHRQQQQVLLPYKRSRSLHHLPIQDYYDDHHRPTRYDDDDGENNGRPHHRHRLPHRHNRRDENDDRRPLIGRAVSQPYLVNPNTSDWL